MFLAHLIHLTCTYCGYLLRIMLACQLSLACLADLFLDPNSSKFLSANLRQPITINRNLIRSIIVLLFPLLTSHKNNVPRSYACFTINLYFLLEMQIETEYDTFIIRWLSIVSCTEDLQVSSAAEGNIM